jgi:uncharacterized damage-inducible protein DinB
MVDLFQYNWDVRDDWFTWCESLSEEEFHQARIGGMKSFRETLIHIVDCELLWLNTILGERITYENRETLYHLEEIKQYSAFVQSQTEAFLGNMKHGNDTRIIEVKRRDGTVLHFSQKKIVAHMITHEIHHIGQLSVWAREIGLKPVSSDLIIRNVYE